MWPHRMTEFSAIIDEFRTMVIKFHFNLHLYLPGGLFLSGFPTRILYAFLFYPVHATCPVHFICIQLVTIITSGMEYKSRISSLCNFLQSSVTSPLLAPDIFLSTLFSHSLSMTNHVSHQSTTTGKIIIKNLIVQSEQNM